MAYDDKIADIRRVLEQVDEEIESTNTDAVRYVCVPFAQIMDHPPAKYAIKGMLYFDSLVHIFGEPESCKSLIALEMALSIANGRLWRGRRTKQCQVVYIAGEGQRGLGNRARAWCQETGGGVEHICMLDRAASLIDSTHAAAVREAIKAWRNPELPLVIIVDTLARNFGSGDENSTQDMTLFVANLDYYLRSVFEACVVLIHHSGHADKTRGRGNSALKGAVDTEFSVAKMGAKFVLKCSKMKDFPRPDDMAFLVRGVTIEGILDEDGEPITAPVLDGAPPPPVTYIAPVSDTDCEAIGRIFDSIHARQQENLHSIEESNAYGKNRVALQDVKNAFFSTLPPNTPRSTLRSRWKRAAENPLFPLTIKGIYCKRCDVANV